MGTEKACKGLPSQSARPGAGPSQQDPLPPALRECLHPNRPGRNPAYLAFIRSRPCAFCVNPVSEPHHAVKRLKGISEAGLQEKGSDYLTIPICRRCHLRLHNGRLKVERGEILECILTYVICYVNLNRDYLPVPKTGHESLATIGSRV